MIVSPNRPRATPQRITVHGATTGPDAPRRPIAQGWRAEVRLADAKDPDDESRGSGPVTLIPRQSSRRAELLFRV